VADVRLEGMDELLKRLKQLGDKVGRVENDALHAGAEVLHNEMEARAPRSDTPRQPKAVPHGWAAVRRRDKALGKKIGKKIRNQYTQSWRTGEHMADNIKVGRIENKGGVKSISVGFQKDDASHFFYAKFQEWGTSKMAAQPFMTPAADEKEGDVKNAMKAVIKGALGI
jgi:HK97 gp10 family phage protein